MKTRAMGVLAVAWLVGGSWSTVNAEVQQTSDHEPGLTAVTLSIDAQPMPKALAALAAQTGMQLIFSSLEVDKGLQAPALQGAFTLNDALAKLLADTELSYEYVNDRTVAIRAESAARRISGAQERGSGGILVAQAASEEQASTSGGGTEGRRDSAAKDQQEGKLEEIIVTAQRREERLQDVPISIAVLEGAQLDRSNRSVGEELALIPGVSISDSALGGRVLNVRGVAPSEPAFAGSSTVGFYLDSVPFGFIRQAPIPDANAYDLDRVEVLRGPQGTLYGASALNGVVRVLTKDPELTQFEGKGRTSVYTVRDGGEGYRADAAVNIPIITDKLGVRIVAGYEELPGWADRSGERDFNDGSSSNVRGKIRADLSDRLSIVASGWHFENEFNGNNIVREDRTNGLVNDEPKSEDFDIASLRAEYDFGGATLVSATSYIDYASDTEVSVLPGSTVFGTGTTTFASELFSQEMSLSSSGEEPWRWSIGGMYRDADDLTQQVFPAILDFPSAYRDYSESIALFGEATRSFLDDRFEATAGLRYFEDDGRSRQFSNPITGTGGVLTRSSSKYDDVSPRAVLRWKPNDDASIYASYSEGFRSGQSQSPFVEVAAPGFPAIQPDSLTSYEIGGKGSLADGLIDFEAAAFHIDWENLQQAPHCSRAVLSEWNTGPDQQRLGKRQWLRDGTRRETRGEFAPHRHLRPERSRL